jgi:hypothetical protein
MMDLEFVTTMKAKNNNDLLVKGFIYLLFACVLIISCKRHVNINDNYGLNNNRIKFIGFDSIVFKIDGLSFQYARAIQYFEDSINKHFTYFNSKNRSIYFFDYSTKKQDFIWNTEDYDGIFDSYYIINTDSIFLFNTKQKILSLYNMNGNFKDKFVFETKEMITDSAILPFPYLETSLPLVCYEGSLYLTGYHVGEFEGLNLQRKTVYKYSMQNKNLKHIIDFPDLYNNYNWGTTYFYTTSSTYNPSIHSLILNYPLCHDLFVYNLKTEKGKYVNAGSSHIESIEPFSKDKKDFADLDTRVKYYLGNASYTSVYYDKYKNIYYRLAALPLQFIDENIQDCWEKRKYSLIILNNNFEYVGEVSLTGILPTHVFVAKNGIHIQAFSNDDIMKFKIINVVI